MPDEGLDAILIQVTVPLPVPMIYAALVNPEQVQGWLCDRARIVPQVGGEYALSWKGPPAFDSPGTIEKMTPDLDLGFSWFAPPPFGRMMNEPAPKTHVYLRLQESPEGVDVTLEQTGWGSGEEWEDARSWHFHFWDERLERFKDYLIKLAYG